MKKHNGFEPLRLIFSLFFDLGRIFLLNIPFAVHFGVISFEEKEDEKHGANHRNDCRKENILRRPERSASEAVVHKTAQIEKEMDADGKEQIPRKEHGQCADAADQERIPHLQEYRGRETAEKIEGVHRREDAGRRDDGEKSSLFIPRKSVKHQRKNISPENRFFQQADGKTI